MISKIRFQETSPTAAASYKQKENSNCVFQYKLWVGIAVVVYVMNNGNGSRVVCHEPPLDEDFPPDSNSCKKRYETKSIYTYKPNAFGDYNKLTLRRQLRVYTPHDSTIVRILFAQSVETLVVQFNYVVSHPYPYTST